MIFRIYELNALIYNGEYTLTLLFSPLTGGFIIEKKFSTQSNS